MRRIDIDAVTFDVYGTILDWEPEIAAFFRRWAAASGLTVTDAAILATYDRLRRPLQRHWPALRYPEVLKRTFDAITAEYGRQPDPTDRETFGRIAATHAPFADSKAALADLRSLGLKLGALSNVDDESFRTMLQRTGLSFDVVVTAQRVGAYKPDHAHFRAALADMLALGIPPERVLHVAQSRRADIVPANALGLNCVWVNRPGHLFGRSGDGAESAVPTAEVASLAEVVELLG